MKNSDSGTKLNPGDRVRVRHDPRRDDSLQARHADRRAAFNGKIVRVETIERDGDVLVSEGTDDGAWFEADELEPIVTDPDGCEIGGPASPLDVLDAAVQQALAQARREAQGWHSAALLARGEAEQAKDALRAVQGEADALRGKLGACHEARRDEAQDAARQVRTLKGHLAAREDALADERGKLAAVEGRLADVQAAWGKMRAFLLALPRPLGAAGIEGVDAVDKALGGVAVPRCAYCANPQANGLSVCLDHGKQSTIDDPVEPRIAWRGSVSDFVTDMRAVIPADKWPMLHACLGVTPWGHEAPRSIEQRVAEVEARLGRLESGEALAKMLEDAAKRAVGDRIFGAVTP